MATIWLGDFRTRQFQLLGANDETEEDVYFVDNDAEYSWLANTATAQLPKLYSSKANIIISLGFNDCVYSCTWDYFNINNIAEKYVEAINSLMELYTESNFYVCSVGPIDDDYAFANYGSSGIIPKKTLTDKIKAFNKKLKNGCKAEFVDCYEYLTDTSFITRDGIRYTADTCESLQEYIKAQLKPVISSYSLLGKVRATEDDAPKTSDASFKYWKHTSTSGGLNACIAIKNGCVLPNCVGYAWGRFYEIIGEKPKLSTGNAGDWYGYNDGYERNKEIDELPKVGAVICWSKPGEAGHVGIVESVDYATGVIKTSESGYEEKTYDPVADFWVTTRVYDKSTKNWRKASSDDKNTPVSSWIDNYVFQGFIYPPQTVVSGEGLCTKNSYGITREEMKPNVQYIWQYFGSRGWTLNAVAALVGNMEQESKMSPCVWENVYTDCETIDANGKHTLTDKGKTFKHGYGLTQWTPATKFFTWCNNGGKNGNANGTGGKLNYWEIDTQLMRIEAEVKASTRSWVEGLSQWIKKPGKGYDLTFNEFITSTEDAAWLAGAFAFCYERPARSTGSAAEQAALKKERGDNATYWFEYLQGLSPVVLEESAMKASNFKIDSCSIGKVNFSFFAKNWDSGEYTLTQGKNKIVTKTVSTADAGINHVALSNSKILPDKTYNLKLTIKGEDKEDYIREAAFKVPQSYPSAIEKISLSCNDELIDTTSKYTLSVTKPSSLGYWKNNTCGYEQQLLVNGKCIKTKTITGIQNISKSNLDLEKEFGYTPKIGDIIQIGMRVWVTDNNSKKQYDNDTAKTSNAICILNKPISTYLNIIS